MDQVRGRGWLAVVGGTLFVLGLAFQVAGGTSDDVVVPRFVALLVGLVCLVGAGVMGLRTRRRSPAAARDIPVQDRRERRRAFFVRLVGTGLLLVPLSLVIAAAAGNTVSVFDLMGPSIVAVIVAALVVATGRLFIPALVVAILLFLLFLMLSQSALSHPESFADFVPAFWRFVGTGVAVIGAFVAMRQRRNRTLRRATPREKLAVRVGALVLIAVSAGSFVLDTASRTTIARADGAIVVNSLEDSFDPDTMHVEKGRVRFLVRNDDSYAHTFTIDELELDQYIAPRSDRLVAVKFPRKGTYDLYCAVTGHDDMTGKIEVR